MEIRIIKVTRVGVYNVEDEKHVISDTGQKREFKNRNAYNISLFILQ